MATTTISRTWYNSLQDDDGSLTVGTAWDKAAVDSLLDAIDALIAGNITFGGTLAVTGATSFGNTTGAYLLTLTSTTNGAAVSQKFVSKDSGGGNCVTQFGIGLFADDAFSISDGTTERVRITPSTGNAWFSADVSALTFTDRTKFFVGNALAELRGVRADLKGGLDHLTLPEFARHGNRRDLGAMISLLNVAVQQLDARLDALEAV